MRSDFSDRVLRIAGFDFNKLIVKRRVGVVWILGDVEICC